MSEFRIKQHPRGYVVEVKKKRFFRKSHWTHFISVAGIPSMPWYYGSFEDAMQDFISTITKQTLDNS